MATLREWMSRFWGTLRGHRMDRDIEDELRMHLDLAAADEGRRSDSPARAARAAVIQQGGLAQAMETMRDQRGLPWLDDVRRDVSYAVRGLVRNPGFTVVAVLTLALGMGATTAIFTLVDTVLLKTLPVKDPQQLVALTNPAVAGAAGGLRLGERAHVSFDEYEALRDRTSSFSSMTAVQAYTATERATVNGQPLEDVRTKLVSAGYFNFLGVPAHVGRTLAAEDERGPGTAPYAVISYGYWQRRFGGAPSVLGTRLKIHDADLTIVGVAPPGFFGESVGEAPDVWVPLVMQRQIMPGANWLNNAPGNMMWLQAIGRLRPGTSQAQAQANADAVFTQLLEEESSKLARPIPDIFKQRLTLHDASTGLSAMRGRFGDPLFMLMGVVAIVLAIACANVATLMLARAESRQKEMGVRLAIGAGRFRIVRQLLTESLTLSAAGALVGTIVALIGVRLLTRTVLGADAALLDVGLDLRTFWFTLGVSVLTALSFGLAPACRSARLAAVATREHTLRTARGSRSRIGTGKMVVMGQIALSVVLLIGAGWFVRTLRNLETVNLGYPRQQLAQVRVNFGPAGYSGERLPIVYEELRAHLTGVPGVSAVAYSGSGPLLNDNYGPVVIEGYASQGAGETVVKLLSAGPDYLATVGIPIVLGRDIGRGDVASAPLVCVVNEAFAKFYFGADDPLGRHVTVGQSTYAIVGVGRDVRDVISYPRSLADNLRDEIPRSLYRSVLQSSPSGRYPAGMTYLIRSVGAASDVMPVVQKEVGAFNSAISIGSMRTIDSIVTDNVRQERVVAQLSTVFGGLALLLACVGLSGVLSYAVVRRTHEIGIRMALGAARGAVIRMILGETALLIAIGLAIGLPASLASARFIRSQLFGLTPADPLTIGAALGIMITVALVAGYLPARRASGIDPIIALRNE